MATNKEKKLSHIQVKDNGIKSSQRLGDTLNEAKQLLERNIFDSLLSSANEKSLTRFKIAQNIAKADFTRKARDIIKNAKIEVKSGLENDKTVNLTPKQVKNITSEVDKGLLTLGNNAVKAYQNTVRDILLNVKSASDLKEQIGKHIKSGLDIDVIYKDGKKYKFDTYMEMKARTDIQQDIGKNMIAAGKEAGVIFYITSFYGDCAPDHADYQGKIYYDENWESMAPKDRLDEIRDYIKKLDADIVALGKAPNASVQTITESDVRLTTRPNCRHYFQYIDIDSVLGAKTPDDVKGLRQERGLNSGGKYKPDKYKALQQQRQNERKIRDAKADMVKQQQALIADPLDKQARMQLEMDKSNIRFYQRAQRKLENQYTNIERRYDREKVGNRVDLGVSDKKIEVEPNVDLNAHKQNNQMNEYEDEKNKKPAIEHSSEFAVDFNIIESREYNDKVLNMFNGNIEDKRNVYPQIEEILHHRSGTNGEDLIVYNLKTKELYIANKSKKPSCVEPDEDALKLIKKDSKNTITIHNHPESLPPSISDLNALVERKQSVGYVVTHDGRIYKYTRPKVKIEGSPLSSTIDKVRLMRYDEENERLEILKRLKVLYDFEFEEVLS